MTLATVRPQWRTFWICLGSLTAFVGAILVAPTATGDAVGAVFTACTRTFGPFWQALTATTFLAGVAVALSPAGARRLGGVERPEIPYGQWLSIILCTLLAGGGVFWSAGEPLKHLVTPPPAFGDLTAGTEMAARAALAQSFFHWGFLAWSVVGALGGCLLLSADGAVPLRPRALLRPLLGDATEGPLGAVIDGTAVVAAVAGTVGPVGMLGLQLSYALHALTGLPDGLAVRVAVVASLTGVATLSAASGVDRGIRWLSRANVWLALGLALTLLIVGPTLDVLGRGASAFGLYLSVLPALAADRTDLAWLGWWTVFYWGWFLGYGPMMSLFVARISRGRTVREIIVGVTIVAPLLTNVWFALLGGTGISLELASPGLVTTPLDDGGLPAALLAILQALPLASVLVPASLVLIFLFLATSMDSMAYAAAMVFSGRTSPPPWQRVVWGLTMGALAMSLLYLGDDQGLATLQSFIVITAVPVSCTMALLVPAALVTLLRRRASPPVNPAD